MRLLLAPVLAALALGAAGCGGSESAATGTTGAAAITPETAAFYLTVNTDLDSDQVDRLEELLAKFPDRERLLAEIQAGMAEDDLSWETDIKPALGDTLDIVLMDFSDDSPVVLLKPADEAKLKELLETGDDPTVTRKIDGWTAIAEDDAALDSFESARANGTLEDNAEFEGAFEGLPDEALAKFYVDGDAATKTAESAGATAPGDNRLKSFAAALGAESSGLKLDGALTAELEDQFASLEPYEPQLLEAAPENVMAFVSGNGGDKVSDAFSQTPGSFDQLRDMLGIDIEGITEIFDREFAFWVGQGTPIPEVTFLAEVENEQRALAALDRVAAALGPEVGGQTRTTEIDGVQAKQLLIDGFPITYAAFDGKVIVTTRTGAIADVRTEGDSLADDSDFEQAGEDAGLPDETFGFIYLDFDQLGALIEGIAPFTGEDEIPPEVSRNLEPLGALVFHSSGEPEDLKLSAFLSIE